MGVLSVAEAACLLFFCLSDKDPDFMEPCTAALLGTCLHVLVEAEPILKWM